MRIDVAGGWIELKERLTVGDERKIADFINPYIKGPVEDFEATAALIPANAVARTAARLAGWHLPDAKPLPPMPTFDQKVSALERLYPETFKPIWDAVTQLEEDAKAKKESESEKNAPADGVSA